ncbi:MAG: hypothetical protein IPP26_11180 [Flavobacteriales bacterium]|nr:hypothetical protein [Flavobacteriales bacterium]
MAKWERILKLAHGRPTRRLELIHQGHVDLYDLVTIYGVAYPRLASWGLLAKLEPVHFWMLARATAPQQQAKPISCMTSHTM